MSPTEVYVLVDTVVELMQVGVLVLLCLVSWVIYREVKRLSEDLRYHRNYEAHRPLSGKTEQPGTRGED